MTGYAAPEMELSSRSDLNRAKSSRGDPCRPPTGHLKLRSAPSPQPTKISSVDQTWGNCGVRPASWAAYSGTAMVTLVCREDVSCFALTLCLGQPVSLEGLQNWRIRGCSGRAGSFDCAQGRLSFRPASQGSVHFLASAAEVNDRSSCTDSWRTVINPLRG